MYSNMQELMHAVWDHMIELDGQSRRDSFRLTLPIDGIENVDQLRSALKHLQLSGAIRNLEECLGGVFRLILTEEGVEHMGRQPA